MQGAIAIGFLVALALAASPAVEAAVKDLPPLFLETPNVRYNGEVFADEVLDYRLPNNTVPLHYDVELTTNIHSGDLAFGGVVKIDLMAAEDTRTVVLHTRQLTINGVSIQESVSGTSVNMTFEYEDEREFLTLTPADTTVSMPRESNWTLTIWYNGTLRSDNAGFYVSTYQDDDGNTRYLATTQFESTDARHGFPCFDEPAKRATFRITMNHDSTYTAISNMPVLETTMTNGRNKTVFQTTPSMPTYLVAFIVSDFETTGGVLNSLPQRIFSRPGTEDTQEWALVSGMLITQRLAEYYGIPFALPKLDQVAVPDFAAGAMENWGLATYREEYLLYSPTNSTVNTQTNIANIVAHEYTHQWFGNLVAIEWWTYLWMKEGFATMFSYKATDEAYPEWGVMQSFHVDDFQRALSADSSNSPRPMTHYIQTPREISSMYDSISYSKAGSVLFMWQHALTDTVFQRGLHNYLDLKKYGAAEEDDLFTAIQTAAKEENYVLKATIQEMMSSWTTQGGYPMLFVDRHYDGSSFMVTQQAYYSDETYVANETKRWYVPFNFVSQTNPDFRDTEATHYLMINVTTLHVEGNVADTDWLILNKQSTGYYRVNYDDRNWQLIIDGLLEKPYKIHPRNRAQLMHDAYHFSSSNRLSHSILLSLMSYLKNEDQYAPWSTANSIINTFNRYLSGDEDYDDFKAYVAELVGNIYDKLGVNDIPGEQHFQKYTRSVAINLACLAGIPSCLEETNSKLKALINDNIEIEPNLQSQTYCNGLKQADDDDFDFVYNKLMSSNDQAQRRIMISSMGCALNTTHLTKFIESSISSSADNTLRVQERITLLSAAYSRSEAGLLACIDFLNDNWQEYSELTTGFGGSNPLDSDIRGMSLYVVNTEQETRLLELVAKVKDSPNVTTDLEEVVKSRITANFNWLAKNRDPLMTWISALRGGASVSTAVMSMVVAAAVVAMRLL